MKSGLHIEWCIGGPYTLPVTRHAMKQTERRSAETTISLEHLTVSIYTIDSARSEIQETMN